MTSKPRRRETVLDTVEETNESTTTTTSPEANQLIQQTQQELEEENRRHDNTLASFKQRVKEEEEKYNRQHRCLEARLLQAIPQAENSTADSDYWLNNRKIPKKEESKKPTKEEKTLIRSRVKEAPAVSKKK